MFGINIYALVGGAVVLALLSGGLWYEHNELADAEVKIGAATSANVHMQQQNTDLDHTVKQKDAEIAALHHLGEERDRVLAAVQSDKDSLSKALGDLSNAPVQDDATARPVLVFAAGGLRNFGEAYRRVRAGDDPSGRLPADASAAGASEDSFPGLKPGFTDRDFAAACYRLGNALSTAATQLKGIGVYQDRYNAGLAALNAP